MMGCDDGDVVDMLLWGVEEFYKISIDAFNIYNS